MQSVDGLAYVIKSRGSCLGCRRALSPLRDALGLDTREPSPRLVEPIAWASVETRSYHCGYVGEVVHKLTACHTKLGTPPAKCPATDARQIIASTITCLPNNAPQMRYPEYRQAHLPITTARMESLVKEMGYRVKGTELFWNDPDGGEVILQARAAPLSDDDRLPRHVRHRPGSPFTRLPKPPKSQPSAAARARKS